MGLVAAVDPKCNAALLPTRRAIDRQRLKMEVIEMNMPGFTAELSLGPTMDRFRRDFGFTNAPSQGGGRVTPQFRFQFGGDPDIGDYLRCRAAGGGDLVCRFFGGLPPFTIGGLLF